MGVPLYQKIKDELIVSIKGRPANTPVSSERDLAEKFDASRMTVRRAINELVDEGYLYRDAKRGTFVAVKELVRRNTLVDTLRDENITYKMFYFDVKASSGEEVQRALRIRDDDAVVRMVRLATIENRPYAVEEIYIARKSLSDGEFNAMTHWRSFDRFLGDGSAVTQRFIPSVVPVQYARLLNVSMTEPILIIENFITSKTGGKLAYVKIFHNPTEPYIEITS